MSFESRVGDGCSVRVFCVCDEFLRIPAIDRPDQYSWYCRASSHLLTSGLPLVFFLMHHSFCAHYNIDKYKEKRGSSNIN